MAKMFNAAFIYLYKMKNNNNNMYSHLSSSHLWDTCKHRWIDVCRWWETVGKCKQWSSNRNAAAATDSGAAVLPLLDTSGTQSCWASTSCRRAPRALWPRALLASPESCESGASYLTQKPLTRCSQWAMLFEVREISTHLFFYFFVTRWIYLLTENTDALNWVAVWSFHCRVKSQIHLLCNKALITVVTNHFFFFFPEDPLWHPDVGWRYDEASLSSLLKGPVCENV